MAGLWGGRFEQSPDSFFKKFNASFPFDYRLIRCDIRGSLAYCNALGRVGVLSGEEQKAISAGLQSILKDLEDDPKFVTAVLDQFEDVHDFVEATLGQRIGNAAKKLHTGRSRNDQVATDFRLYIREEVDHTLLQIHQLQEAIVIRAEAEQDVILPGFTHLQKAQAITWSHFLLSYFQMLERDKARLIDARKRLNILPLGSGALAGNNYPIDRQLLANELGFEAISQNSLDATSDRDFVVEVLSGLSLIMVHLSRLSEDLIIYCSSEYDYLRMSDAVSTGSSLMPQKKNPDALELIRGKSGRVQGNLMAMLTVLKGLPSCYNKDLQEDKELMFDGFDTAMGSLAVMKTVISSLVINPKKMLNACKTGYLNATDLADYLVSQGTPFREAHHIVGRIVLAASEDQLGIEDLSLERLQEFSSAFAADVYPLLTPEAMVAAKKTTGSTAPDMVRQAIDDARSTLTSSPLALGREFLRHGY